MTLHSQLPTHFTLPVPIPDPRPRGIHSLGALSTSFSIRFDAVTMERLRMLSEELGITPGEFSRWCATQMVHAIDKHLESTTNVANRQSKPNPQDSSN